MSDEKPRRRGPWRTKAQVKQHRARIAHLICRGVTIASIARELGLSRKSVRNDIKAIEQEWRDETFKDFSIVKGRALAEVDGLKREYWRNYSLTAVRREGEGESEEIIQIPGQKKYLDGVGDCIDKECKILGIYAAVKTELLGKDGSPLQLALEMNEDDRRKRMVTLIDRLFAGEGGMNIQELIQNAGKNIKPGGGNGT